MCNSNIYSVFSVLYRFEEKDLVIKQKKVHNITLFVEWGCNMHASGPDHKRAFLCTYNIRADNEIKTKFRFVCHNKSLRRFSDNLFILDSTRACMEREERGRHQHLSSPSLHKTSLLLKDLYFVSLLTHELGFHE